MTDKILAVKQQALWIDIKKDIDYNTSVLMGIRNIIDTILYDMADPNNISVCDHPINERTCLTVMGGNDHWQCNKCGYEYIEEAT